MPIFKPDEIKVQTGGSDVGTQAAINFVAGTNITFTPTNDPTNGRVDIQIDAAGSGSGDVVGPGSATDNAVARFDSTTGKLIQNSVGILSDTGDLSGLQSLTIAGSTASNFIDATGTLNNATGNEIAYSLQYVVNKATSGNSTGLLVGGLFTSAPGTNNFILDLQNAGTSRFSIDSAGQLISAATTWTLTTATTFTLQDILLRPLIYADATSFKIQTNPVYIEPTASTGVPAPSLTTTTPAHTNLTASTEVPEMLIDFSTTKTWLTGTVANQRALKILAPTLNQTSFNTFTEAATISISGPPDCGANAQIITSIGFKLEPAVLSIDVENGIGFVIYAPSGAFNSNACGSFMDGTVGINTLSSKAWLDVKVPTLGSARQVTCIDAVDRACGMYVGGTVIPLALGTGSTAFMVDFGYSAPSNSSVAVSANLILFRLEGSVNYTGNLQNNTATFNLNTSAGATTQATSMTMGFNTVTGSTGTITTARSARTVAGINGTGTVTTYVGLDQTFTPANVAVTITTGHYIRMTNPSKGAAATMTNWDALLIESNTATIGTRSCAIRVLGTTHHSRHEADIIFGSDATPSLGKVQIAGNLAIANAGLLKMYESGSGNFTSIQAGTQAADIAYVLPLAQGAASTVLTNDGSGNLSWAAAGGSSHALLSATHTDTVASAVSRGSLIYGNSTPAWAELNIGAAGTVLTSDGTDVSWAAAASAGPVTYMKTSGTTANNNTFANDSVMAAMTLATGTYTFIGFFWVSAASTTPDFKFQLVVNTSTVNDLKCFWHSTIASGAVQEGFITASASSSGLINVAASGQTYVRVTGSLDVTNAGTLDVEWAQNTTDAVNLTTMNRGSFFQLTEV